VTWTIRSVIAWAKGYLETKGSDSPRLDAELLLADVLAKKRIDLYLDMDRPLNDSELAGFRNALKRRADKEPIAYILGRREFYSHDFIVNPHVLIPRPETELLVDLALEFSPKGMPVFEIGVGTGAVIISLLLERQDITGFGNDISLDTIRVAQDNGSMHGISQRLFLYAGDVLKGLCGQYSTILANPPYIAADCRGDLHEGVRRYEPEKALFAGNDGLDIIKEILAQAPEHLLPGGKLIMEVGYDQKDAVEEMALRSGAMKPVRWAKDLAGIERAVILERMHG